jgi:hypothetical protein
MDDYDPIPARLIQKMRHMAACERVREIPGFPMYAVSENGVVFSVVPYGNTTELLDPPRQLKPHITRGVIQYQLWDSEGKRRFPGISRILALAFHGLPPDASYEAGFVEVGIIHADNVVWQQKAARVNKWIESTQQRYAGKPKKPTPIKLRYQPYSDPDKVGYKGAYNIAGECVGFLTMDDTFLSLASCYNIESAAHVPTE